MGLISNIECWKLSLANPEPHFDEHYLHSEIVIRDENLLHAVSRLRDLVMSFCVLRNLDFMECESAKDAVVREIHRLLTGQSKLQYTEFVAFWKCFDMSYSIYAKLPEEKQIEFLKILLESYCNERAELYKSCGLTHSTVQALYDAGASRKQGGTALRKLVNVLLKVCSQIKVVNIGKHIFVIEAKHIKEAGGAQDKQIVELIDFIRECEQDNTFHYVSFLDGAYFNELINPRGNGQNKAMKQREEIFDCLSACGSNYFVNTSGFVELIRSAVRELETEQKSV